MRIFVLAIHLALALAEAAGDHVQPATSEQQNILKRSQIQTIVANVKNVTRQAAVLANELTAITPGDIESVIPVSSTGIAVQSAINQSVDTAESLTPLSLNEAVKLVIPVHKLVGTSLQVLNELNTRKQIFVDLKLAEVVLGLLETLNSSAVDLHVLLNKNLPSKLQAQAKALVMPVFEGLDTSIGCYKADGVASCRHVTDPKANFTIAGALERDTVSTSGCGQEYRLGSSLLMASFVIVGVAVL